MKIPLYLLGQLKYIDFGLLLWTSFLETDLTHKLVPNKPVTEVTFKMFK